jgi:hypothetical protein
MKAVEMMAMLTGGEPEVEVEEPELELEPTDVEEATAGRSISLRLAQAIINNTK